MSWWPHTPAVATIPYRLFRFDAHTGALLTPASPSALRRILALSDGSLIGVPYAVGFTAWSRPQNASFSLGHCPALAGIDTGISPSGDWGVVVGLNGDIVVVRAAASEQERTDCLPTLPARLASTADISDDGRTLCYGSDHSLVCLKDGVPRWTVPQSEPGPLDLCLSPDERWVATSYGDHTARVYRASDGALRAILAGHQERVVSVDFSPDSRLLLTASWDRTVHLWSTTVLD